MATIYGSMTVAAVISLALGAPQIAGAQGTRVEAPPGGSSSAVNQGAGAFATGEYRNLFVDAGHAPEEVRARIEAAFRQLFHGDSATQTVWRRRIESAR